MAKPKIKKVFDNMYQVTIEGNENVWIFSNKQLSIMIQNYRLGNCPITIKGLDRYCVCRYGSWGPFPHDGNTPAYLYLTIRDALV